MILPEFRPPFRRPRGREPHLIGTRGILSLVVAPPSSRQAWWRDLARLDTDAVDWRAGFRAAVITTTPVAVGLFTGRSGEGLLACFGALNVEMADQSGAYCSRMRTLIIACVATSVGLAAGTLSGVAGGWALPVLAGWLLGSALLGVFGPTGDVVGFFSGLMFVVGIGLQASEPSHALEALVFSFVGGACAVLATAVAWPLRPHLPEFRAVARAVEACADGLDVIARYGAVEEVVREEQRTRRLLDEARATVLSAVPRHLAPTPDARTLLAIVDDASTIAAFATALDEASGVRSPNEETAVRTVATQSAALLRAAASGLRRGRLPQQTGAQISDKGLPPEALVMVDHVRRIAAPRPVDWPASGKEVAGRVGLRSIGPDRWRHAIRLAMVATVGFALSQLLRLEKGYWVMITIVVVLKPSLSLTRRQATLRIAGTLIGALLGLVVVALTDAQWVLVAALFVFCTGTIALTRANYGLGVVFLTPMILVLVATADPGSWQFAEARVADTLLGAALGIAGSLLLWRGSERDRLRDRLAHGFADLATALDDAPTSDPTLHRGTRQQLDRSIDDIELSYRRFLAEPSLERGRAATPAELIEHLRACAASVPALAALGDAAAGSDPQLEAACNALSVRSAAIAEALARSGPPTASTVPTPTADPPPASPAGRHVAQVERELAAVERLL